MSTTPHDESQEEYDIRVVNEGYGNEQPTLGATVTCRFFDSLTCLEPDDSRVLSKRATFVVGDGEVDQTFHRLVQGLVVGKRVLTSVRRLNKKNVYEKIFVDLQLIELLPRPIKEEVEDEEMEESLERSSFNSGAVSPRADTEMVIKEEVEDDYGAVGANECLNWEEDEEWIVLEDDVYCGQYYEEEEMEEEEGMEVEEEEEWEDEEEEEEDEEMDEEEEKEEMDEEEEELEDEEDEWEKELDEEEEEEWEDEEEEEDGENKEEPEEEETPKHEADYLDESTSGELNDCFVNATNKNDLIQQKLVLVVGGASFVFTCTFINKEDEIFCLDTAFKSPEFGSKLICSTIIRFEVKSLKRPYIGTVSRNFVHRCPTVRLRIMEYSRLINRNNGFLVGQDNKIMIKIQVKFLRASYRKLSQKSFECPGGYKCKGCHIKTVDCFIFCVNPRYLKVCAPLLGRYIDKRKSASGLVRMDKVHGNEFAAFLNAVYPSQSPVNAKNVAVLSDMAYQFKAEYLLEQCEEFLCDDKQSSEFSFSTKLELACSFGLYRLQSKCLHMLTTASSIQKLRVAPEFAETSINTRGELLNRLMLLERWDR